MSKPLLSATVEPRSIASELAAHLIGAPVHPLWLFFVELGAALNLGPRETLCRECLFQKPCVCEARVPVGGFYSHPNYDGESAVSAADYAGRGCR